MTSGSAKMIQGVREVFEIVDVESNAAPPSSRDEGANIKAGKLVLIGRGLTNVPVEESLRSILGV